MTKRNLQSVFTTAILFLASLHLVAQGWEKPYQNTGDASYASDVLLTNDNAYIALGQLDLNTTQIVKADLQGNVIWNKEYRPTSSFIMNAIVNTDDGGYAMTGQYYANGNDNGIPLSKLNNTGDILWTKEYGCCNDWGNDLIQTDDGGYLIVGIRAVPLFWDSLYAFVIKTDPNGNVLWDTNYFQVFEYFTGFKRVIKRGNGNYLLLRGNGTDVSLTEIDINGNVIWDRLMENPNSLVLSAGDMTETQDGGILVGGTSKGMSSTTGGILWKLDSANNLIWMNATVVMFDGVSSISENEDGDLFIGRGLFIEKRDSDGTIICWLNENLERGWGSLHIAAVEDGGAIAALSFKPDPFIPEYYLSLVKMDTNCLAAVDQVRGNVNIDADSDCINNGAGDPLKNWLVELSNGLFSYYTYSDTLGNYEFTVNAGNYNLTLHEPISYWGNCAQSMAVSVGPSPDTVFQDLQAVVVDACPYLVVDLASPPMRPCVERTVHVHFANLGTATAIDPYIQVSLDTLLMVNSASVPFIALPGNVYQFDLDDLQQGDIGQISFQAFLDCDAELGTTVCFEANIYPDTLCGEEMWAGAVIEVEGNCDGDTVLFEIKNIGSQGMVAPLEYIVVEDHVMYMMGNFQLDMNESIVLGIPNDHFIYAARAQQEPGYPYGQFAIDLVAFCLNTNNPSPFSTGFFNQFPFDDGAPTVDIECVPVSNSYDPNQLTATPMGYGDRNYIEKNTPIEYHIDFQNTGNDTAYNVVIRDALSERFDMRTLIAGASSHAYDLKIEGENILVFNFPNINLVDSVANEPLSHGFVEYKIGQMPDLPLETEIENTAAIYFDFNDPILTNTTLHTIGELFISVDIDEKYRDVLLLDVYPNPIAGNAFLQIKGFENKNAEMHLFNSVGQKMEVMIFENGMARVNASLGSGVYFFQIMEEGKIAGSGKLVIK